MCSGGKVSKLNSIIMKEQTTTAGRKAWRRKRLSLTLLCSLFIEDSNPMLFSQHMCLEINSCYFIIAQQIFQNGIHLSLINGPTTHIIAHAPHPLLSPRPGYRTQAVDSEVSRLCKLHRSMAKLDFWCNYWKRSKCSCFSVGIIKGRDCGSFSHPMGRGYTIMKETRA